MKRHRLCSLASEFAGWWPDAFISLGFIHIVVCLIDAIQEIRDLKILLQLAIRLEFFLNGFAHDSNQSNKHDCLFFYYFGLPLYVSGHKPVENAFQK